MEKIFLLILIIGLESCSSQKKIETTNQYFDTGVSTIQEWVGGRSESSSSFKLKVALSAKPEGIYFEEIYFRKRILSCKIEGEGEILFLLAEYDSKAVKKVTTEKPKDQFPFELLPTEAIVGYKIDGSQTKYLKITGIKEKAPLLFSSKPQN